MKIERLIVLAGVMVIISLLSSCQQEVSCPQASTTKLPLDPDDKAKLVYSGIDTIRFESGNDSLIFKGKGKTISEECLDKTENPDCPRGLQKWCYETNLWSYEDQGKEMDFQIELSQMKSYTWKDGLSNSSDLVITFGPYKFYYVATSLFRAGASRFIQEATFSGKTYHSITVLYKDMIDSSSKVFMTKDLGVVRVELDNKQTIWDLK